MFAINRSTSGPESRLTAILERRNNARTSRSGEDSPSPGRGQDTIGARGPSQNYVSGNESGKILSSGGTTPAATPTSSTSTTTTAAALSSEHPGLAKLRETLRALGMNPSLLNVSYSEETVGYPGGSYVNKQIKVQSGDKTENFCADLTAKNPYVTAYEMQRYFGV